MLEEDRRGLLIGNDLESLEQKQAHWDEECDLQLEERGGVKYPVQ